MHTPTKTQWQTVIDNFKTVLPFAKNRSQLDMLESSVCEHQGQCGTVHCVAGWYAVALINSGQVPYNDCITYRFGANEIARHLGFEGHCSLEVWAFRNPEIWGNQSGSTMFCSADAYNRATTLAEVVTFLEGVRDRSTE